MTDPWQRLLDETRAFHGRFPHDPRDCGLCIALAAFPETPSLFDPPIPDPPARELGEVDANTVGGARRSDPSTSKAAARFIEPRVGTLCREVYDLVVVRTDGITTAEVCEATGRVHQTMSRRITDLRERGWIEDSGLTRPSAMSGRDQVVWTMTAEGRAKVTSS